PRPRADSIDIGQRRGTRGGAGPEVGFGAGQQHLIHAHQLDVAVLRIILTSVRGHGGCGRERGDEAGARVARTKPLSLIARLAAAAAAA
nr:hypothetical protein [Tanacetum cinerariifolium]